MKNDSVLPQPERGCKTSTHASSTLPLQSAFVVQFTAETQTAMTSGKNTTLLDLVWAMTMSGCSERALVATVTMLVNTGQVRLCGTFAGARIEETAPDRPAPPETPDPKR